MAEYIEREAALNLISDIFFKTDPDGEEQCGVIKCSKAIRNAPAADVVEVVRCKDCRYSEPYLHNFYCENDNAPWAENTMANLMDANDFCSYGERKCENG